MSSDMNEKVQKLREKRKMKNVVSKLGISQLEYEQEDEEIFNQDVKEGLKKFEKKSKFKYNEEGDEITPFNMYEELEEGFIDNEGAYVYNKRADEYDPWYDSVKDDIKKQEVEKFLKKRNRDEPEELAAMDEKDEDYNYYGEEDLYYKEEKITDEELKDIRNQVKEYRLKLLKYLQDKETVQKAIQRLKPKNKNEEYKKLFDELLDLVSKLTELSFFDVYTDTIEKIKTKYNIKDNDPFESDSKLTEDIKWKYRMISDKATKEFGPFNTSQIKEWYVKKYLNDTDTQKFEFQIDKDWFGSNDPIFINHIIKNI